MSEDPPHESAMFFTGSISTNKIVEYAEREEGALLLFFTDTNV